MAESPNFADLTPGSSSHGPSSREFSGLECVVNISEGRRRDILENLAQSISPDLLLDVHIDPWHHRSVWTLLGIHAPRQLTRRAIEILHIDAHQGGVHPRLGVVDVVPFVPLGNASMADAVTARDDFARWLSDELAVPSFLYGPPSALHHDQSAENGRTLPEIRRGAWTDLSPDCGPTAPHSSAGAVCVGARAPLVAYNIWLRPGSDWSRATAITAAIRSPEIRALTLRVDCHIQISTNLIAPLITGPADLYDQVRTLGSTSGIDIERAELVGLIPQAILDQTSRADWPMLDLSVEQTIEYRIDHGFTFVGAH